MSLNIVFATLALIVSTAASFEVRRPAPKLVVPEGRACVIAFDRREDADVPVATVEVNHMNVAVPVRYNCRPGWRVAEVTIALELFDPATSVKTARGESRMCYDATQDAGYGALTTFGLPVPPNGRVLNCRVAVRAVKGEGKDAEGEVCETGAVVSFR